MPLVFPDGYLFDSICPYLQMEKNNDAGYILSFHRDLTEWFSEGYVWVVDCDFRDVFDVFEGLGLETKMPTFLKRCLS